MARTVNWYPKADMTAAPLVLLDATKVPIKILRGMRGMSMPTWSILTDTMPGVDAARFREAVIQPRVMQIPVWVQAADRDEFRLIKRQLARDFDPTKGVGALEFLEGIGLPGGRREFVRAVYAGGLEGDEGTNAQGTSWWAFTLTLTALDPYAYNSLPTVGEWAGYPPVLFYPILPLQLSRSDVVNTVPLVLTTDKPAWPVWELKGPFTKVTIRNDTTGKQLQLARTTTGTETVRVVTEPGLTSIRETSQDVRVYPLSDDSELFTLDTFDNLTVTVDNATSQTLVRCTVHSRALVLT